MNGKEIPLEHQYLFGLHYFFRPAYSMKAAAHFGELATREVLLEEGMKGL